MYVKYYTEAMKIIITIDNDSSMEFTKHKISLMDISYQHTSQKFQNLLKILYTSMISYFYNKFGGEIFRANGNN